MLQRFLLLVLGLLQILAVSAQQTVGLFAYEPGTSDGYTMFYPSAYHNVYLIDNCGRQVHTWELDANTVSCYLQEDGNLLRSLRISNPYFNRSSQGGRVERWSWEGDLLWGWDLSDSLNWHHHDAIAMPNGNVLLLSWRRKSEAEAIAAGRNMPTPTVEVWATQVVEVEPIGMDSGRIVWRWSLWDHLVQDYDSTKQNFDTVALHPQLFDLNQGAVDNADWLHANSIDYHAGLDQIVISLRFAHEFIVIDHSTTTAEAAGHSGGLRGKGGDILYRWGNPKKYNLGDDSNQILFDQHNVHWIPEGMPGAGDFLMFNNGYTRPGDPKYSEVIQVTPPVDAQGNYARVPNEAFGPATPTWKYQAEPAENLYSPHISGVQRTQNGSSTICSGFSGQLYEVNAAGDILWSYKNPVGLDGPVQQGTNVPTNQLFRAPKYAPDYPGLAGKALMPGEVVELNPGELLCKLDTIPIDERVPIHPNVSRSTVTIGNPLEQIVHLAVRSIEGRIVFETRFSDENYELDMGRWSTGLYIGHIFVEEDGFEKTLKLLKY